MRHLQPIGINASGIGGKAPNSIQCQIDGIESDVGNAVQQARQAFGRVQRGGGDGAVGAQFGAGRAARQVGRLWDVAAVQVLGLCGGSAGILCRIKGKGAVLQGSLPLWMSLAQRASRAAKRRA